MRYAENLIEAALNYIDEAPLWGIDFEEGTVGAALKQLHDAVTEYRNHLPSLETLIWHNPDNPPNADLLVLLHFGDSEDDHEVYPALWDGEFWCLEGGTRIKKRAIEWAHLPAGTQIPIGFAKTGSEGQP
jgi:hypothetical protein